MRFKEQFEFHKVPEWDEHYLRYARYLEHIEKLVKKMTRYGLNNQVSNQYDLSSTYQVVINESEEEKETEIPLNTLKVFPNDDSLSYSSPGSIPENLDLEAPLLSLSTDIKEILVEFVSECKGINDFYLEEKQRIINEYELFYKRFLNKINSVTTMINLHEDLKLYDIDGLGYSSSWSRKFVEYYSKFSWLDGFAKINIVAMQKILLKFDKTLFLVKESKFNRKLNEFIHTLPLSEEKGCTDERKKIRNSVSKYYFNNKKNKAFRFLESTLSAHKSEDRGQLKLLLGVLIGLSFILGVILLTPPKENHYFLHQIKAVYPIFRGTLSFIFTLLCCGVVIVFLKEFRVNYVIIFESSPANRLNPSGMYILTAVLMVAWLICMIGEVAVLKDYLPYKHDLFAIILLYTFLAVFFNPLRIFQSVIRFPAIIATFHCLYSPFSEVRFLEFFVADVMTSLVKPFIDVSLIICWASSTDEDNVFDTGKCHSKMFWAIFAWYLPFHIRFWQCVNKWWYTGDAFPHLVNAGKYFASIVMICSNYFYGKNPDLRNVVLGLYLFATVYSYIWDIIMDWGLLRDKRMLRAQILYPPRYYYFSCITNFFLRFAWTLGFIPASYWPDTFRNIEGLTLILAIMEIYRRAQWSLFRLENENINNYEKYRTVLEIPRLPKD